MENNTALSSKFVASWQLRTREFSRGGTIVKRNSLNNNVFVVVNSTPVGHEARTSFIKSYSPDSETENQRSTPFVRNVAETCNCDARNFLSATGSFLHKRRLAEEPRTNRRAKGREARGSSACVRL